MNFFLKDVTNYKNKEITGEFVDTPAAITLRFDGYGERTSLPEHAVQVLIENRNGVPHVVIWSDINQEDPTHVVSLANADLKLDKYPDTPDTPKLVSPPPAPLPPLPATPNCDAWAAVHNDYRQIVEFIEWLADDRGIRLCHSADGEEWLPNVGEMILQESFCKMHNIDNKERENERRKLLDWQRQLNERKQNVGSSKT